MSHHDSLSYRVGVAERVLSVNTPLGKYIPREQGSYDYIVARLLPGLVPSPEVGGGQALSSSYVPLVPLSRFTPSGRRKESEREEKRLKRERPPSGGIPDPHPRRKRQRDKPTCVWWPRAVPTIHLLGKR